MAARTSSSLGMNVLVTVLAITSLGFFVTTVMFFARANASEKKLVDAQSSTSEYINDADQRNPLVQRFKELGKKEKKSAVGYIIAQQEGLMRRVTGTPTDTLDTLNKALGDDASGSVLSILKDRQAETESVKKQLKDAEEARDRALADKENEVKRVKELNDTQQKTLAALTSEVQITKTEGDRLRESVNGFKSEMDGRVEKIRSDFAAKESALQSEIDKLQRDRVLDKGLIARLQGDLKGSRFVGTPEYALVDGTVIGSNVDGTYAISIGRKNRVVLGLPFEVYGDATQIRPDPKTGEYPRGKAAIEVVSVENDAASVRIVREQRGNPVVRGDVIANAVFDPNKKYKFLVYGNFDPQNTGIATSASAADIKARIQAWGGSVVDELSGDIDFIVLGSRPTLPPEPSANASVEEVQQHIALQQNAKRYDELLNQATTTSIPVLNENRLSTLTGGGR